MDRSFSLFTCFNLSLRITNQSKVYNKLETNKEIIKFVIVINYKQSIIRKI